MDATPAVHIGMQFQRHTCSAIRRNTTLAAHVCEVQMELNAERNRRSTRIRVQEHCPRERMIPSGSNDERLVEVDTGSFMPTSVSLFSLLATMVTLHMCHG